MTKLQITYFLTIVEYGSFTRAAQILYVTQPTITQQIIALEKELGFSLFDRLPRHIRLTPAGQVMLDCFRRFDEDYQSSQLYAKHIEAGSIGTISVGFLSMVDNDATMEKIKCYCDENPNVSVSFHHHRMLELSEMFFSKKLDFIFIFDNLTADFFDYRFSALYRTEFVLVISNKYPIAQKDDLSINDFLSIPMVSATMNHPKASMANQLSTLNLIGLNRNKIIPACNLETAFSMVSCGYGFMMIDETSTLLRNTDRLRIVRTGVFQNMGVAWREKDLSSAARQTLTNVFNIPVSSY